MKVSSLILLYSLIVPALCSNWDTYPSVPKTASVNGFDRINSLLPECGKECPHLDTGNTPCPYWDTGCLCVMPQWSGPVAQCFASSCSGEELVSCTSLALSLCSSVGANMWLMPASVSTILINAVNAEATGDASATDTSSAKASNTVDSSGASSTGASSSSTGSSSARSSTGTSSGVTSSRSTGSSSSASASSTVSQESSTSNKGQMTTYSLFALLLVPLLSFF